MTAERELLLGLVDHLEADLEVPGREPWTSVQSWYALLLPVCTDAGLLWEYTGSSSEGVILDDGETLGGFWVLDPAVGLFDALATVEEVQSVWTPAIREQVRSASREQVRRYATWAYAMMER